MEEWPSRPPGAARRGRVNRGAPRGGAIVPGIVLSPSCAALRKPSGGGGLLPAQKGPTMEKVRSPTGTRPGRAGGAPCRPSDLCGAHTPLPRPCLFPSPPAFFSGDFLYLGSRWVENSSTPPSPIHPPGRLPASLPSPTGRVGDPRCTGGSARDAAGRGGRLPPAALQVEARAGPSAPAIKRKAPEQDALLPALPAGTKVPRSPSPR